MNPLFPLLVMQGAYYISKRHKGESRRNKHSDFYCDNPDSWNCEHCNCTYCKYYMDCDPDEYDLNLDDLEDEEEN